MSGSERSDAEAVLRVEGLRKRWPDGRVVLDGIDLEVRRADVVVLLGPNGCGKSTLLRCLNLLEGYQEGRVLLCGAEVSRGSAQGHAPTRDEQRAVARLRQRIGMVFQQFNLFPHLDALGNVAMGPRHVLGLPRPEAERVARDALRRVGLEDRAHDVPGALSGGQQQRVAIARALAMGPELMLFDEPTSALDPVLVREVFRVMRSLAFDDGMTMLVVTHDLDFAREVADRVLFLDAGRVAVAGTPAEVFASDDPRVRAFLRDDAERR
ncbi:MAG: amino acid ABC transporter ATP-binding protein [Planctomycetes bacterium]|nr:amino acid ABC transporter ATP-binding protein [Planctomycetota bacterium]